VKANKARLEAVGYDVICVFIDIPLETAINRNRNRDRKLPDELVTRIWQDCENNKSNFKSLFGADLYIVRNDDVDGIRKGINRFLNAPIRNPIGKDWIKTQLQLKNDKA
jgi:tRNA uridine 5-carbamoylmethylation protein Kti12